MSEAQLTFMSPGDDFSPGNILIPPNLRSNTDKLLWYEAFFEWAQTLRGCAHGGDSCAKGAAATIGLTLYRSREFAKKEVVKKAVRTGELQLAAQSDDDVVDQMSVVKKVFDLVAKDSTVDLLRWIVRLYKEINCRSKESIQEFTNRFAGPTLLYLNLINSEQDSSGSQNFAIILLLNSSLSAQTFNNIISKLAVSTKTRNKVGATVIILALKERIENVVDLLIKASSGDMNKDDKIMCVECHSNMKAAIFQLEKPFENEGNRPWIGLQDAIRAPEEAALEKSDVNDTFFSEKKPESSTHSYLNSNKSNKRNRKHKYKQENYGNGNQNEDKKTENNDGNGKNSLKDKQDKTQGRTRYTDSFKGNGQSKPNGQPMNNGQSKAFFQ